MSFIRPTGIFSAVVIFFMPLYPILFDRIEGSVDDTLFNIYLTYLAYRLPLDALFGVLVGLVAIVPLQWLWPKVPYKGLAKFLAFVLFFVLSAVISGFIHDLTTLWFNPESSLSAGEPLRQYNWLARQFTPIMTSIYVTLSWQKARLPDSLKSNGWFDFSTSSSTDSSNGFSTTLRELLYTQDNVWIASPAKLNSLISKYEKAFSHPAFNRTNARAQWRAMNHAGRLFLRRYESEDNHADLDAAIKHWQNAFALTNIYTFGLEENLTHLGVGLLARYERDGNLVDLDDSIDKLRESLRAAQRDTDEHTVNHALLAKALGLRSLATQNSTDQTTSHHHHIS